MKTYNFEYIDKSDLIKRASKINVKDKEVFIQVFCWVLDKNKIKNLQKELNEVFPNSKISWTTTDWEIISWKVKKQSIIISVSLFEKTNVKTLLLENIWKYNILEILEILEQNIIKQNTKCLIIFADWISSVEWLLDLIYKKFPNIYVSWWKSGDNYNFVNPYIFDNKKIIKKWIIVTSLSWKDLNVYTNYNFSWTKVWKQMKVTKADWKRIYELDNKPVYDVYKKYLWKIIADQLPKSWIQFPLIIDKSWVDIARDVLQKFDDWSLLLAWWIKTWDIVNFWCWNTDDILSGIFSIINDVTNVPIESVFLYSCTARKRFLWQDIIDEILPLSKIYNISWFFTYWEFYHTKKSNEVLNETLTFLFLSETKEVNKNQVSKITNLLKNLNFKTNKEKNSYFALSHLVKVTNQELQEANNELINWNRNLEEKILVTTKKIKSQKELYLEWYKWIIDNINEMICIIDKNRFVTYANKQFLNTLWYELNELEKIQINELFLFETSKIKSFTDFDCNNKKFTIISKNNKTFPVIITKLWFVDNYQTLIIKNLKEISDLKWAYKKLKELDKKKDEFLNIASHELRTPMTTIKGYISMLIDWDIWVIDEEAKKYLNRVYKDSQRLILLINDMLDISKIESWKMEFNFDLININKLLEHVILDMQLIAKEKNIEIVSDITYNDLFIYTDLHRLRQVFVNIIWNAVKFTNNFWKIEIISFVLNKKLIIIIKDNWIWIKKEDIPRIFEKFSQVNNSLTREIGWTWLWLPISLDIIKKLKWNLFVESELWVWSQFKIILPINK